MYFTNVNILGSQCAHSANDLVCYVGLKMTETQPYVLIENVVLTYIINNIIYPEEAFTEQKYMDTKFIHCFRLS